MPHPLRIVAADDEPDLTRFYHMALSRLGHQVVVAGDRRQLVELGRSVRPHLVITDAEMPQMSGFDAVEQIWRERPMPVVVVSASDPADLREQAPQGHALHFLRKPVRVADLEGAIALVVG